MDGFGPINVTVMDPDLGVITITVPQNYSKTYADGVCDGIVAYLRERDGQGPSADPETGEQG